ncbi:ATP-binding protein [Paucibacter sp. O1-1]|nr:ATP-binding protein [Paucibacter sp. O1-1]MDA3830518.1 ATP-binding protein [Paucibacter sp. O1-1]
MDRLATPPAQASVRESLRLALAALVPAAAQDHPDFRRLVERDDDVDPDPGAAPLQSLGDALALTPIERVALALAWWVELDAGIAAALAALQSSPAHGAGARPSLGLLQALAPQLGLAPHRALGELLQGPALSTGLLRLDDEQALLHARPLRLAPDLLGLILAGPAHVPALRLGAVSLPSLAAVVWPLPQAWDVAIEELAGRRTGVLLLRGRDREELQAFAAGLGRQRAQTLLRLPEAEDEVLAAQQHGLVPALLLAGALPLWQPEIAPGQRWPLPPLPGWPGLQIVLAGPDVSVDTAALPVHEFELGPAGAEDRRRLWAGLRREPAGAAHGTALSPAVSGSRCSLAALARAAARELPPAAALEQELRAGARELSAWAQVSSDHIPAEAWVGPPALRHQLELLLTRCRARADLGASLGPLLKGRLGAGVKALFIGASGTGKTLAAQWLADRLARPLLRVDLAAVVSKYIGETEKNLAQLLARAEQLDALLLFDEADSLFGARTDVKQANDRYANMQTNYLLQRLESYHGVALLTSNSKARFDEAFMRRLDAIIEFALPDVGERRALWALHLGTTPALDPARLNRVAALVDLPGGHIRNAVLSAALLARQRAEVEGAPGPVSDADLHEALLLEYRKLGQRLPDGLSG